MDTPEHLKYTTEHEWAKVDGDLVVVGITDFAQDALGEIVYVELPDKGDEITKGDSFAAVESTKSVSDLFAPISGEIVDINEVLIESPETVNDDPYGEGWIAKISPYDRVELEDLMNSDDYNDYVESQFEE